MGRHRKGSKATTPPTSNKKKNFIHEEPLFEELRAVIAALQNSSIQYKNIITNFIKELEQVKPDEDEDVKHGKLLDMLWEWSGAGSQKGRSSTRSPKKLASGNGFKNEKLLLLTLFSLIDSKIASSDRPAVLTRIPFDSIFYSLENDADLHDHIDQIIRAGTSTGIPLPKERPGAAAQENTHDDDTENKEAVHNPDTSMISLHGASDVHGGGNANTSIVLQAETSIMNELDPNQSINAPSGFKYLYSVIGKNLANPSQMKSIRQIINDVIPAKSKWAKEGRQGQEKMLAQMERVLSVLRNYNSHSFPFLKPVQKKEAPGYHDIIKTPMDLSTVLKKLKAFQYSDKQDFAKDLDLIWENCLTYNTSPDSLYRVHANKMRDRCNEALKQVIEAEDDDDEDGDSVIEEIVVKDESILSAYPITGQTSGHASDLEYNMDVVSEADSAPPAVVAPRVAIIEEEEEVDENLVNVSLDECFLTHEWKLATNLHRAQILKKRLESKILPFGERPARLANQDDVDGYISNLQRSFLALELDRTTVVENVDEEGDDDGLAEDDDEEEENMRKMANRRKAAKEAKLARERLESSFFLPELYPLSIPAVSIPSNPPHYLRDFYVYEDAPPNPIPVPPQPSISEYPQIYPDMTSSLNYHLMNNVSEFKRLKHVYRKIVAKQSGDEGQLVTRTVPTVRGGPFQRNYRVDQLPPFHVDEGTCLASLERIVAILISHQGFDSVNQSSLSTVAELMVHFLTSSARLLKSFRDEMGKENTEMEILIKVLAEMGVSDVTSLQTYIDRDVIRHGKKLHDLRIKLESAWVNSGKEDVFAPENNEKIEVDVDQHEDDIMNGTFLEDMGVDFLNIKELGLDIKIPAELWNRKNEIKANARIRRISSQIIDAQDTSRNNTQPYPAPPEWSPLDPSKQIGLLHSFYERLQMIPDAMIEDEHKTKTKEAKLLIKCALAGGRKKIVVAVPGKKKTESSKGLKPKKERKKKKKDQLAQMAAELKNKT